MKKKASKTSYLLCLALLLLSSTAAYASSKKNDSLTDDEDASQNAKLDDAEGRAPPAFRIRSVRLFLPRTSPSSSAVPLYTFTASESSDSLVGSAQEIPPASTEGHTVFVAQNPELTCEVQFAQTRPQQLSLLLSLMVQNDQRNDASSSSAALVTVRPRQIPFPSSPSSLSSSLTVSLSSTKFFLPVNGVYSLELLAADRMTQHRVLLIKHLTLNFASRLKLSPVPVPPSCSGQPSSPSSMWSVADARNSSATTYNLLSLPLLSQPSEEEDTPVRLVFPTDTAFLPKPLIFHSFQQPGRRPHWAMSLAASLLCTVMALVGLLSTWFLTGANFKLLWRLTAKPTTSPAYPTGDSAVEKPAAPTGDSLAEPATASSSNLHRADDKLFDLTTATWTERCFSQRIAVHLLFMLLLASIVALLLTYFFVWNLFQTAYALIFLLPLVSLVGNQVLCDVRETRMSDKGWIEIANYKALDVEPLEETRAAARKKKH